MSAGDIRGLPIPACRIRSCGLLAVRIAARMQFSHRIRDAFV
jgi:hypothetical protein